jgi:glycosyltransferase involved in cell wall biosynthesis
MTCRVALLTPFAFPSVRGNAVTVDRIARGLAQRGVELQVWDVSQAPESAIAAEVADYQPSLVHAFHAWRVGPLALKLARRAEIPLVVTLTGTDANHDLFDPGRAAAVRRVLEGAAAIVAFHESIAARIRATLPDVGARLVTIPQAADLETEPYPLAARWPLPSDRVLFLLPGGIRPVKNPRMPLEPLGRLAARDPRVRLAYAGPILDRGEGHALQRAIQDLGWVRYLGTVPHHQMASLVQQSDVVLNCSVSEGGMANSLLEALSLGRAVLASAIDGNRSLVEDGVTGFLFGDESQFEMRAEQLAGDPLLRERLGHAGRARVRSEYPPSREIKGHLDVYRRLVPVPTR